jgi:hypothetical protein
MENDTSRDVKPVGKLDSLGEKADNIANSKWYRLSPVIAVGVLSVAVVFGIGKGLAEEQGNKAPDKQDYSITGVDK